MRNKEDIVKDVSNKTGLSLTQTRVVINSLLDLITTELESGEFVRFTGFGTFGVKEISPTKARNFSNGEFVDVPKRKAPFFKAGDVLKRRVRSS